MIGLQRGIVKLVPYTSEWKRLFDEEERALRSSIGNYVIDIQHVGSTAIPGIEAKPIIDIAVALKRLEYVEKCIKPMERLGYEYKVDRDSSGQYFFAKGKPSSRTHYVHMVEWNSDNWKNYLLFRDYLRVNKEVARKYAKLKRELVQKFQGSREFYTPGKAEFIESVLRSARCEFDT